MFVNVYAKVRIAFYYAKKNIVSMAILLSLEINNSYPVLRAYNTKYARTHNKYVHNSWQHKPIHSLELRVREKAKFFLSLNHKKEHTLTISFSLLNSIVFVPVSLCYLSIHTDTDTLFHNHTYTFIQYNLSFSHNDCIAGLF